MDTPDCPDFALIVQALALLSDPQALDAEARDCLAECRRPCSFGAGLPEALAGALAAARAQAARQALERADATLWAAAERCQRGWAEHVGWQRIERELTATERQVVCVNGRKGRRLQSAWVGAKRRATRS